MVNKFVANPIVFETNYEVDPNVIEEFLLYLSATEKKFCWDEAHAPNGSYLHGDGCNGIRHVLFIALRNTSKSGQAKPRGTNRTNV
jgi:hypothetical protein